MQTILRFIYKEETKSLSFAMVENEFAASNGKRKEDFGNNKFV